MSARIDDAKIQEVELTALRNEMREWQGRRFVLATIGVAFTGAAIGLAKEGGIHPYYRSMAVLVVLWMLSMLTWYATLANRRGSDYLKARYPQFEWEAQVDRARADQWTSPLQLSHMLFLLYLSLGLGHLVFAYVASDYRLCIAREGFVAPTLLVSGAMSISWLCAFLPGLRRTPLPSKLAPCATHREALGPLRSEANSAAPTGAPAPSAAGIEGTTSNAVKLKDLISAVRSCNECKADSRWPNPTRIFCDVHSSGIYMFADGIYGSTSGALAIGVLECPACERLVGETSGIRRFLRAFIRPFELPQTWMLVAAGLVVLMTLGLGWFHCRSCH